jgi:hypothetical protein
VLLGRRTLLLSPGRKTTFAVKETFFPFSETPPLFAIEETDYGFIVEETAYPFVPPLGGGRDRPVEGKPHLTPPNGFFDGKGGFWDGLFDGR